MSDARATERLQREAERLEQLRSICLEERIAADIENGQHESVLPELAMLIAAEPLRERRWALLMTALYRPGDRQMHLTLTETLAMHSTLSG